MNAKMGLVGGAVVMLVGVALVGGLVQGDLARSPGDFAVGAVVAVCIFGPPAALVGAFFGGLLGGVEWTRRPAPARLGGLGTIATWMVVIAVFGGLLSLYRAVTHAGP